MKNIRIRDMRGFTLVELLIVITLIAILSVAVLATINPIEQTNKAKDASTQNDAAEILNSYERYYANTQKYPWMDFNNTPALTIDSEVLLPSTSGGFGICYTDRATNAATVEVAPGTQCVNGVNQSGALIYTDELKPSFANKAPFRTNAAAAVPDGSRLWSIKALGSNGAINVCFIPRSKSGRQNVEVLKCITNTAGSFGVVPIGTAGCTNPDAATGDWSTGVFNGTTAMFRCVPE